MPAPTKAHPDQHFGNVTYAQHFDDGMILNLFDLMGIEKPSYLDLGAHDPWIISNTALLYSRGSWGINVEANEELYLRFKRERGRDINVWAGVSPVAGVADFYKYSPTCGRNTFSEKEVERLKSEFTVKQTVRVKTMTLEQIVGGFWMGEYPDLLSCDIEGLDYDVLSQLPSYVMGDDPELTPKVVCVETRRDETGKMKELLERRGHSLYCRMGENLFFVRNDFVSKVY